MSEKSEHTSEFDELKESEERYETLFNAMLEGFAYCRMLYDREGHPVDCICLTVNPAFERITGLKNVTGKKVTDFLPGIEEDYPEIFETFGRVVLTGRPEKFEINFTPISKWLNISVYRPAKDHFVAVFEDITERRQGEMVRERIRSWQAGVNRILESVLAPVPPDRKFKIITDGVVEIFGADFCRIWLIEKGDLCNAGCIHAGVTDGPGACIHRDRCLHLKASSGRYTHTDGDVRRRIPFGADTIGRIASGPDVAYLISEVQNDPRIGDHEWARRLGLVSFAAYRLKPPEGEVLGVFALFSQTRISPDMDTVLKGLSRVVALVIQKEIAEERVRQSRDYSLKLFDDFPNPIRRSDTHGKANYFNSEWLAFTGRTLPQETLDGWAEGIHPDDYDRCMKIFHTAFVARESFGIEYRLRYHDGTYHWLLDSGKPFYDP